MTLNDPVTSDGTRSVVAVLTAVVGLAGLGYGLLLLPQSGLGGAWIVAIGLSLFLSGLFATEWAGNRLALSPATRRNLSLAFGVLAVVLLVAFVLVNGATFEAGELEGDS